MTLPAYLAAMFLCEALSPGGHSDTGASPGGSELATTHGHHICVAYARRAIGSELLRQRYVMEGPYRQEGL
jgi:hypothetical protein